MFSRNYAGNRLYGALHKVYRAPRRLYRRKLKPLYRRARKPKHEIHKARRFLDFLRLLSFTHSVRFIVHRLIGKEVVALDVEGVSTPLLCRTSGSDWRVLRQIFRLRWLDIDFRDPCTLIMDGGANVGYASIYFAHKYPNAQIIAVEPEAENCALFRKNCAAYPNIELIQGGL